MIRLSRYGALGRAPATPLAKLGLAAQQSDLGDDALFFAEELIALDAWHASPNDQATLGALVLTLLLAEHGGSTCVPLGKNGPLRGLLRDLIGDVDLRTSPATLANRIETLVGAQHLSSLVGRPGQRRPIIVDELGSGTVYTHQMFELETRVATAVRRRIAPVADGPAITPAIGELSPEQAHAVAAATKFPLTLIAGGPGTGKTTIVRALTQQLTETGATRIALAAPTGKAAHRLREVFGENQATTLHRLLGRHLRDDPAERTTPPLALDALIIDESSMMPMALFDVVLAALPATARLILLGDPLQLPAVGAGQVFADLCEAAGDAPWCIMLTYAYRQSRAAASASLVEATAALRRGDKLPLRQSQCDARALPDAGFGWINLDSAAGVREAISAFVARTCSDDRYQRFVRSSNPEPECVAAALTALESRRLLTVTRHMIGGSLAWSQWLHQHVLGTDAPFAHGDPILVTQSDWEFDLANGDAGVVVARHGALWAAFAAGDTVREVPLSAVQRSIELAWAQTVHKSQGTEADEIMLVLPERDSPIATRPLLYTALTRARRAATLVGSLAVAQACVARTPARASRLKERLQ